MPKIVQFLRLRQRSADRRKRWWRGANDGGSNDDDNSANDDASADDAGADDTGDDRCSSSAAFGGCDEWWRCWCSRLKQWRWYFRLKQWRGWQLQ
jgi:hypothetical protein